MRAKHMEKAWKAAVLFIAFILSFALPGRGEEVKFKGFVLATANLFSSSDSSYRNIYGGGALLPEVKVGVRIWRSLYAWGGFGWLSDQGSIPPVNEGTKVRRTMIGGGAGWSHGINKLTLRGEMGLASISYKEEALGDTGKGSGMGWRVTAAADYRFWKKLFLTLQASWFDAKADSEAGKLKLGGFLFGAGIGIQL